LRYREPLTTARPLVVRGRIEVATGRRLTMSGELTSGETTAVTAQGLYIVTAAVADLLAEHTTGS
jgi:acyl-CoA thioesterase FadM